MHDEDEEVEGAFKAEDEMEDMPEGMNDFGLDEDDTDPESRFS